MKRILFVIAASALMASAAQAAFTVDIDVDQPSYEVGDVLTIELELVATNQAVGGFQFYEYQANWDPAVFRVVGSDPGNGQGGAAEFGTSTQQVFAGLSGSTTPVCFNTADSCVVLSQLNSTFPPVNINTDGIVTASLQLQILGGAGLAIADVLSIIPGVGALPADGGIGGLTNYASATIVPEPTTVALLGLGLVGLGVAGRRR